MIEIRLPFIGPDVEGCRLLQWIISPGDHVEIDQDLAKLQVDDEVFYLPSPLDGIIRDLCIIEGELIAVGEPIALIEED